MAESLFLSLFDCIAVRSGLWGSVAPGPLVAIAPRFQLSAYILAAEPASSACSPPPPERAEGFSRGDYDPQRRAGHDPRRRG